ncbi:hypothetical protein OESDEN_03985 [Oesophagostomum dentatum]|uniref:Uncharacterized protein n=1 Tax=Oesophagostomum dentatum TaxID=61180 RepID=A0A0B1TJR2_OESDE|nr:hypothetical protein OESDEN_03985 [Oesophagostomum dentatum]
MERARSENDYFNYNKLHSIILLACCSSDCKILAFDIGVLGGAGDADWCNLTLTKEWIEEWMRFNQKHPELVK